MSQQQPDAPLSTTAGSAHEELTAHSAWNPGLRSPVPREVLPLSTLYRPQNTATSLEQAQELAQFTGLPREELVVFRAERLIIHELLIRVAADIRVPSGADTDDLGINFRAMVSTLLEHHVQPHLPELIAAFETQGAQVRERVAAELARTVFAPQESASAGTSQSHQPWWKAFRRRPAHDGHGVNSARDESSALHSDEAWIDDWKRQRESSDRVTRLIAQSLLRILGAIRVRHGRIRGDAALLCSLVSARCMNVLGSEQLGTLLEPMLQKAGAAEGFEWLPAQNSPVVMNTKGASAAGKSSQRQRQRALASRIGVDWADFALISPDIFRKYLLDYDSLGTHFKYAGMLTGEELRIVDQKLDRHLADKARLGRMPHLLIDRFRFDSFAPDSAERGSNLLTRFGTDVFMFFMITAPHLTVERAWERGLRVGRFKTVDDLLYHNVEAFGGMPELFFTWALNDDKRVHYEFLDNDVAHGDTPRTVAFGSNGTLRVLRINGLLNIERYRSINIDAQRPAEVYTNCPAAGDKRNLGFVMQCLSRLRMVEFVRADSARLWLRVENGRLTGVDHDVAQAMVTDESDGEALQAVLDSLGYSRSAAVAELDEVIPVNDALTLGLWGDT